MTMRRFVGIFSLFTCFAFAAHADPSRTIQQMSPLAVGQPCPSFGGMTLDNQALSLKRIMTERQPDVVVISFFATWCQACKAHLPTIEKAVTTTKGVSGVLIDYGEEPDLVTPFVKDNKLTLPVIADKFAKIAARLGVSKALPRTIILDARGYVSTIFETEGDDFDKALRTALDKARSGK
jgi:thiol-disulfide isomerase/thioredoxin